MTRAHTILALLAATGAASRSELVVDTGWGIAETNSVLDRLIADGQVVPYPAAGNNHAHRSSKLLCLPADRAQALNSPEARRAA